MMKIGLITRPLNCLRVCAILASLGALLLGNSGCNTGPRVLAADEQRVIDRKWVEYPSGTELRPYIAGLTSPTGITFDSNGSILIAESGADETSPRIFGFTREGKYFDVYPKTRKFPFVGASDFEIFGPIGGMVAAHGKIYVTHRDASGGGVITALDYDGGHKTLVGDLPARGDHSVTDIAVTPDGRLVFGMGSATNSGVVGLDNMSWLRASHNVCDQVWTDQSGGNHAVYLLGWRFNTTNPFAGLFGGGEIAVTAPFQTFGQSIDIRIPRAVNGKPNAAVFSIDPEGGDLQVEAHGVRYPTGLAFNDYGALYMTNQGMKLRGTRPVKDDPDVLLKVVHGQWYGWPDFSANLVPIQEARFQPPMEMLIKSGYRELSFLVDHGRSDLTPPARRQQNLLAAEFQPLAGASKLAFLPGSGPLSGLRQNRNAAVVALSGDRSPWDSGGQKLVGPIGYKLALVNVDNGQVEDFIRNTQIGPASRHVDDVHGLERPIDVKFGPDGAMYILDFGQMEMRGDHERIAPRTGRVFRLAGAAAPTTNK